MVTDAEALRSLRQQLTQAKTVAVAGLCSLLNWPMPAIVQLTILLVIAVNNVTYRVGAHSDAQDDLLDAMLDMCPTVDDKGKLEPWLAVVLTVAGYKYALAPEEPLTKIANALHRGKFQGLTVARLRKKLTDILKGSEDAQGAPSRQSVQAACPEMTGQDVEGLLMPAGWRSEPAGLRGAKSEQTIPHVWISGVSRDLTNDEHYVRLHYQLHDGWRCKDVPQQVISDRAKIVALAAFGIGITSNNANDMIQYLAEFMAANQDRLTPQGVASQLGWQHVGVQSGFLLGHKYLLPRGSGGGTSRVTYQGRDVGDQQLADGYVSAGKLDCWTAGMSKLAPYPAVVFAINASLAAPLLQLMGVGSMGIDIAGITSSGKTTLLSYAASVWGVGDVNNPASLVRSFNATSVYRERLLQVIRDLPVFIDETKLARDPREVTELIYAINQGRSRGRGSTKGMSAHTLTRNITFITGEQSASSFSQDGGTRVRVLSMCELPFGEVSEHVGQLISELNAVVEHNYGLAGRKFVQFLLDRQDQLVKWRERFVAVVQEYERRAGANGFARRLAPCLAVIRLAAELGSEAGVNPFPGVDPVEPLYEQFAREAKAADRPAEALVSVVEDAIAHKAEMTHDGKLGTGHPPRELIGDLVTYEAPGERDVIEPRHGWREMRLTERFIERSLKAAGYSEFRSLLKEWRRNGWINPGEGSHLRKKVKVDGLPTRLICIPHRGYAAADKIVAGE